MPAPHVLLEVGANEVLLAAKGVVERGLRDAGTFSYPVDANHMHAFRVEELVGGGQQPFPGRFSLKSLNGHALILLTGLSTDVFEQHLDGGSAAVDGDGCTGDVAGFWRRKESDHFGYLLGLGGAIEKSRTS